MTLSQRETVLLEDGKTEETTFATTARTAERHPVLSATDPEHGEEILRITMSNSTEKQVLNLQLKNGQYVITIRPEWMNQLQQPHPVVCSGNHDATLFYWLPPNSTIGCVGPGSVDSQHKTTYSQCGQPLAWTSSFSADKKVSTVLEKKTLKLTSRSVIPPAY